MSPTMRLAASASVCGAHQTFYKLSFFHSPWCHWLPRCIFLPLKRVVKSLRRSTNEPLQLSSLLMSLLPWRKKNSDTRSQESHTAARLVRFTRHSRKLWLWTHENSQALCKETVLLRSPHALRINTTARHLFCSVVDFIKFLWEPLCLRLNCCSR